MRQPDLTSEVMLRLLADDVACSRSDIDALAHHRPLPTDPRRCGRIATWAGRGRHQRCCERSSEALPVSASLLATANSADLERVSPIIDPIPAPPFTSPMSVAVFEMAVQASVAAAEAFEHVEDEYDSWHWEGKEQLEAVEEFREEIAAVRVPAPTWWRGGRRPHRCCRRAGCRSRRRAAGGT